MHIQAACCVAQLDENQIFTVEQLGEALGHFEEVSSASCTPELYEFDHLYSSDPETSLKLWQGGNATAAVLYATPGTQCFHAMHKLMKAAMARQHARGDPSGHGVYVNRSRLIFVQNLSYYHALTAPKHIRQVAICE